MPELADVRAGDDGDHAGRLAGGGDVDGGDPRMRVGAPDERHVEEPGERQVVGVAAGAHEERAVFAPPHGAPDEGRLHPLPALAAGHRGHRGMLACL